MERIRRGVEDAHDPRDISRVGVFPEGKGDGHDAGKGATGRAVEEDHQLVGKDGVDGGDGISFPGL